MKYNGEMYFFDIAYTYLEHGKYYAVTKKDRLYRLRYDILNGVRAERCEPVRSRTRELVLTLHSAEPENFPLDGEHYLMANGASSVKKSAKCPLFGAVHFMAALGFRLLLLIAASLFAYFFVCRGNGISFAESLFPTLSLKRLKTLVLAVELVGSIVIFFIKGDNTDIFDIVNCACLPVAIIWGIGAVKSSIIIAVAASIVLVACVCLYVLPLISERIHEERPDFKREIERDIAAQSVYVLSLCLATCIFGTSVLGISGYSGKVEYSKSEKPEISYLEMLGELKKWDELDSDKRLDVLSDVHSYEAGRLGIDGVTVCSGYPASESEYGAYNPITNEITVNRALVEEGDVLELIDTVIHETRHVYQRLLADAYTDIEDTLDEKYKSLSVFVEAKAFRDNAKSYTDAGLDALGYYYQPLETDAREYASERINSTYKRVLENTYYFE